MLLICLSECNLSEVEWKFFSLGLTFELIPMPVTKNFSLLYSITSCKIPQTFFPLINKSLGFFILIVFKI